MKVGLQAHAGIPMVAPAEGQVALEGPQ
jgi:hypothetical protein